MFTLRSLFRSARGSFEFKMPRASSKVRAAALAAGLLAAASVAAQRNDSQEALVRRYPFDPACAFGRVANGKGMIVRCLSEEEANWILKRTPVAAPARAAEPAGVSPPAVTSVAPPAPVTTSSTAVEPEPAPGSVDEHLEVTVGPVVADQGELSVGKLSQGKSRYERCVLDHGGLKDRSGQVDVRFLVRSKGIAEGVSVQKRVGVSAEAARCVSDVVDRRRVGVPDAPLVGATVTIKFDKVAK